MKKLILTCLFITSTVLANAQWLSTKHSVVVTAMFGGDIDQARKTNFYSAVGRCMWFWKNAIAFGADIGITSTSGQYRSHDAMALNGYAHLKLPFGFYAEGGLGYTGLISEGRRGSLSNSGVFWSLGYAKKLNSYLAIELQYRNAPVLMESDPKNILSGLRIGLSLRI